MYIFERPIADESEALGSLEPSQRQASWLGNYNVVQETCETTVTHKITRPKNIF